MKSTASRFIRAALFVAALLPCAMPHIARADALLDIYPGADDAFSRPAVFPNWGDVPTAAFYIWEGDDVTYPTCLASSLKALTLVNYGTATGGPTGDIRDAYFIYECGGTKTAGATMTYAGVWGGKPAWTWAGTIALPNDPCTACWCWANLFVYTDISPCPTDAATIELGPNYDAVGLYGGVTDSCGYRAPTAAMPSDTKTIRYLQKTASKELVTPGDTMTYNIFYGKPGTTNPVTVIITDTQPLYTHLVPGGTTPDPGWDPNPVSPPVLRWTVGGLNPAGGATGLITFNLTVDWGNGESFEPGSGDVAAPEGAYLFNNAHISWTPTTTCAPTPGGGISNTTATPVKRFLFWKLGDNDMLYQGRMGMPDDEMTYSIFVKNISSTKTWWNVSVWDTVPLQLDAWSPGYGIEDSCAGWTMTPTGCAPAAAGRVLSGTNTILTWRLDLPPQYTIELRWRAKVKPSGTGTALNRASIMAYGRNNIVDGTGHSLVPRNFTHEAPILLRTTYVSYVSYGSSDGGGNPAPPAGYPIYWISFYPLNKACDFALYKKWCASGALNVAAANSGNCAAFAATGGRSPAIDEMAGTCTGGPGTDWETGCKAERTPARYVPSAFLGAKPTDDIFNFLHKVVANGPVVWELNTAFNSGAYDADTYAGTTNLSFCGYMSYTNACVFDQSDISNTVAILQELYIVNTDETTPTTVFVFSWDQGNLSWNLEEFKDIYNESQWVYHPPLTPPGGGAWAQEHYRIVSSDGRIMVHKAYPGVNTGAAWNDFGTMVPNRENGNLVNKTAPATFYPYGPISAGAANDAVVAVGNISLVNPVNYTISRYVPFDTTLTPPMYSRNVTPDLVGAAGYWVTVASDTTNPGLATSAAVNANPHVYGPAYDGGIFTKTYALYKVKFNSGQGSVYAGVGWFDLFSGGCMLHASKDASGNPGQSGREFWIHETSGGSTPQIYSITAFAPSSGTYIQCYSGDGVYSLTYSTDASDEAVSFTGTPNVASKRNYLVNVTAAGSQNDIIAQYTCGKIVEKFYTAPFLSKGTYYDIIVPPVVFVGQSFWLTVVVMDTSGSTRTNYTGTTSFSSTDPTAKIQATNMEAYNYAWLLANAGVKVFINVSFTKLGMQTIMATDTMDGSIVGVASFQVVGADIRLEKRKPLSVAASGDTVQFRICWSNYSSATGYSFTITDAVPNGTSYVPELAGNAICGQNGPYDAGVSMAASNATSTTPPNTAFVYVAPATSPAASTRWLRWTIRDVYVNSTGCVCFKVIVN
jgi:uncharacterized repeat protein (TIGR01451 family)